MTHPTLPSAHPMFTSGGKASQPIGARAGGGVILLLAIVGLPSMAMFYRVASSMAAGVMLVCLAALGVHFVLHKFEPMWPSRRIAFILKLMALLAAHAFVAMFIGPFDSARFVLSIVLLALFLLAAIAMSDQFFGMPSQALHRAVTIVFYLLFVSGVFGLLEISPPAPVTFGKPVFPFTEPSHFALSIAPFFLYFSVLAQGSKRFLALTVGLVLALSIQNMTMLAVALLVILICARPATLLGLAIPVLIAVPFLEFDYFSQRLEFSPESTNLSVLVFIQGWQLIEESLRNSNLWGLGFQQLGVFGTKVPFADIINTVIGDSSNLTDGGFNLSKLVSEFGILGIAIALTHMVFAWRYAVALRRHAQGSIQLPNDLVLAYAAVVGFSVDMWVRGNGYFTSSSLFFAMAVMFILATSARQLKTAGPGAMRTSKKLKKKPRPSMA